GRYLGTTLCVSPALTLAGTVLLAASSSFSVLVLGRLILGFAYTLGTVSGLIALLRDDRGPGASVRLNIFEFSAMIGVLGGICLARAWSAVSQFLLPVRGTREFGLDRSGVSGLLMLAQLMDLVALLPVGRLADGLGRTPVLGFVIVVLGLGTAAVGLGSFPWFVAGCACFGFGLAGWMLPVGVIREHTRAEHLAWRMGL